MATVNLDSVWLNVAADPTESLSLPTTSGLSVSSAVEGEVRRLANGRTRNITRAGGKRRTVSVAVAYATRAEIEWLEDHIGVLLCARDNRGRKVFGVYHEVEVDEHRGLAEGGASLSLTEVSFSEAV